jgi:hypothetical protein
MSIGTRFLVAISLLGVACSPAPTRKPPAVDAAPSVPPAVDAAPPPVSNPPPVGNMTPDAAVAPPSTGGETPGSADAGAPPAPTDGGGGGTTVTPPEGPDTASYSCTLMFGINATQEWWTQGFETMVDNAKWELTKVHSGFIELWADPNNGIWKTGLNSPCATNAMTPDRIIFVALNFDFTTLEQWLPPMMATAKNLRMKYPSAKRIELGTFVRAPGNKPCPQAPAKRSTIQPAEDQAIEMVVATDPTIFKVAPKFEAKDCKEFSGNPPHPSAAGGAAWAKMAAAYYGPGK